MRLNWSNIGKGMGDIADAVKEKRLKDDLRAVTDAGVEQIDVTAPEAGAPANPQASGVTTRYKMLGVESDTPFTKEQIDDLRTERIADVYAKHGLTDRSMSVKDHLASRQRQRKQDARSEEEFGWKKKDRATAEATAERESAVRSGVSKTWADKREAEPGSDAGAQYQRDLVGVVEGQGLEAAIRKAAGPGATKDEIDAAIEAYRGSLDETTAQHNAAGMSNLYKQQAQIFGEIGGDPAKAAAALKMAEAEGLPKLVERLKAFDIDGANKLWNSTGQGRGIIKGIGKDGKTGDLYAEVIDPYSGQRLGANGYVNISAMERALMSAQDVAKMRESDSKVAENEAQAEASRAKAEESRASREQTVAETDRIRKGLSKNTDPKVEANEVSSALGTPALDRKGQPKMDPVTGRQMINRNMAEEDAFYRWMAREGLNDTNAALLRWKAGERDANMPKPAKPKPTKPFDPDAFFN